MSEQLCPTCNGFGFAMYSLIGPSICIDVWHIEEANREALEERMQKSSTTQGEQ